MHDGLFVKMAIDNWRMQVNATNKTLAKLSDGRLMKEIVSGRNRGIYLLGHLVAVHDLMFPLLRFQEAIFPELHPLFVDAPDKEITGLPSISQLREQWEAVNQKLSEYFDSMTANEWFLRHSNVSEEDFRKEPYRNRLNVLLSRTNHLSNHRGQLILLIPKN